VGGPTGAIERAVRELAQDAVVGIAVDPAPGSERRRTDDDRCATTGSAEEPCGRSRAESRRHPAPGVRTHRDKARMLRGHGDEADRQHDDEVPDEPAAPPTPRWWTHRFGAMTTWACSPIKLPPRSTRVAVRSIIRESHEATTMNTSAFWRAMPVRPKSPREAISSNGTARSYQC